MPTNSQSTPSLLRPPFSSSMFSQRCSFFVSSFHQSVIIPFNIHHIPHRYRSTRTKSVLINYPTPNSHPYLSFLFLLHANSNLPFPFTLHNILQVLHSIHSLVFFFLSSSFSCTPPVVVEITIPLCMYTRTIVACYKVILEGLTELLRIPFECTKYNCEQILL